MSNLKECSAEQLGSRREKIDAACSAAGIDDGKSVVILGEDGICSYRYSAPAGAVATSKDIPSCSVAMCQKIQEALQRYCHDKGLPSGTPVPVYTPEGEVCYCYCS